MNMLGGEGEWSVTETVHISFHLLSRLYNNLLSVIKISTYLRRAVYSYSVGVIGKFGNEEPTNLMVKRPLI